MGMTEGDKWKEDNELDHRRREQTRTKNAGAWNERTNTRATYIFVSISTYTWLRRFHYTYILFKNCFIHAPEFRKSRP